MIVTCSDTLSTQLGAQVTELEVVEPGLEPLYSASRAQAPDLYTKEQMGQEEVN